VARKLTVRQHAETAAWHFSLIALTSRHREFLLSLVRFEPAWDLMPFAKLQYSLHRNGS